MQTPFQALQAIAARQPDHTYLLLPREAELPYARDGLTLSYAAMLEAVAARADRYAAAGWGRGRRVALLLENRPEYFVHWWALNAVGAAVLPLNPDLLPAEMGYLLEHGEAAFVVALSERVDQARAALGGRAVPVVTPDQDPPRAPTPAAAGIAGEDDECALLYTSGTTGRPKGCILTNRYFMALGDWYLNQGEPARVRDGQEVLVTPLPMFHNNAMACSAMAMLMSGGTLVQLDRFHPSRWWRTVAASGATIFHYLGVMPAILLKLPETPEDRAHRVRFGFGAGVDPKQQLTFEERFGMPLIEGWAMTETGAGACIATSRGPRRPGERSIGTPGPEVLVRIVDEQGAPAQPGVPGELLVRSSSDDPRRNFFSGYLKDPEATDKAWEGGWFHTGDVVRQGEDGSLFFVDRWKNIVRRSGENIAVIEVEGALDGLPGVAQVAVAPVPDDIRGEEVCALFRARDALPPEADARRAYAESLFEAAAGKLAYHKLPGWIGFVETLPVTATQKLQRGELKKLAAGLVEGGACFDLRDRKKRKH